MTYIEAPRAAVIPEQIPIKPASHVVNEPNEPAEVLESTPAGSPRKSKSRVLLNFWLDVLLLLNVVCIAWLTSILQIVFPAPTQADGWTLWGLTFDQFRDLQSTALGLCAILAIEHLVLHWNWVCSTIATRIIQAKVRPDEGLQAVYGVGTFIALLLFILSGVALGMLTIQPPPPR